MTLELYPHWLPLPLGYPEQLVLQQRSFDGWLAARDRATEARRVRLQAIATATPRAVGTFGVGSAPLGINVTLAPLRAGQAALGGQRALRPGAARTGVWVIDADGIKLRTGVQFVTRTIGQPWSYKNPSGPGERYTDLDESRDGRVRVYWRWMEGGTLERDDSPPVTLPPGQYNLSPDGRWLASYPGIDSNRPAGTPPSASITRLSIMNVADEAVTDYSGDLRYTAYRGHEDWGYQPPRPQWSPSSTFVVYRDWDADRSYVINVLTGARIDVGPGTPQWAPEADILLIADEGAARLFNATAGTVVALPPGPKLDSQIYTYYFDMSGRFVVRSRIALSHGVDVPQTTAFDLRTGRELARWQGAESEGNPEWRATDGPPPLEGATVYGDAPVFATRGYQGCTSLLIHHPRLPNGELCFELGSLDGGGAWSIDGRYLASGGYVFDIARREAVHVGANSYNAMWSPDGSVVAFRGGTGVKFYAPATRELLEIRTSAYPAFWYGRALILNPASN